MAELRGKKRNADISMDIEIAELFSHLANSPQQVLLDALAPRPDRRPLHSALTEIRRDIDRRIAEADDD